MSAKNKAKSDSTKSKKAVSAKKNDAASASSSASFDVDDSDDELLVDPSVGPNLFSPGGGSKQCKCSCIARTNRSTSGTVTGSGGDYDCQCAAALSCHCAYHSNLLLLQSDWNVPFISLFIWTFQSIIKVRPYTCKQIEDLLSEPQNNRAFDGKTHTQTNTFTHTHIHLAH